MEKINKEDSKEMQTLEEHSDSKDSATCSQNIINSENMLTNENNPPKMFGNQNSATHNEPNSANEPSTEKEHDSPQNKLTDVGSMAVSSNVKRRKLTENNSLNNSLVSQEAVRKRHTGNIETPKHSTTPCEHYESLESRPDNAHSPKDCSIDTTGEQQSTKASFHGQSNVTESDPGDLPEFLTQENIEDFSLFHYLKVEITRSFEEQEEIYIDQREKVYTFMKTPRELEKLMWFGFLLCLDCFLFVFTYLPVRVFLAIVQLLGNVVCLKFLRNGLSLLEPHQTCDLLRGSILLVCFAAMNSLDLSILYHIVRGQSVIKLYVIYNMLDIADRLFSSIGQDTLDTLFWTAAEPRQKRRIVMVLLHFGLASVYVFLHAVLVLFQAITLNVAINSHNKVLMVVMVSNQFVELKGCVFKKFEKNNLFQMSCADIRERFYYVVLVSLVTLRNMHELQWNLDHLYELIPSVALLLSSEVFVDWVKHAFITKFNCISSEVYHEYRELLALDATTSRLFGQRTRSDHFDLVSRRLGFIPLPLGCVVYRVTSQSVKISGTAGIVVLVLVYLWLTSVKILNSIIMLGLSSHYVMNKRTSVTENKPYMESSPSPSDLQLPVSDPLERNQNKASKVSKPRQVKALNEIDRYTLCSNRIV